jgi:hypothetical protein
LPGPGAVESNVDSTCVSFKKRLTKYNALDQSEGAVVQEHWCALFEEHCPVIGATAKAPECLRNAKNRTVRDNEDNTLTKIHPEYMNGKPANTFVTVPLPDGIPTYVVASDAQLSARQEQIGRLREEAQSLRNSLREFCIKDEKKNS